MKLAVQPVLDELSMLKPGAGLRDLLIFGVLWWGWHPGGQGAVVGYRPAVRATAATIMPVHGSTGRELSSPVLA